MVYSDPRRSDEVPEVSFKTLAETSPVSIVTLDGEGKITYANRRAEEVLGLDKGEITDRTYDDPDWEITDLDGDPYPTRRLPFSKVKRTREPAYDEKLAIEGPGGERRLLSIDASPLFDESGEFDGVIGVVRNITSQANAKSGSTRSKNLYEQLVETMNSGVAVYEAVDHGDDFVFKELNEVAEGIEDVDRDKVIGRRLTDVFPEVEEFGLLEALRVVYKTGKPRRHPISIYEDERIGGSRSNYIYKLPGGEVVAIYEDITERKQLEESQRELIYDLDERNKELNLLYGVAELWVGQDLTLEEVLQRTVNLIPPAWQYPNNTCARITYEENVFQTDSFNATQWEQSADLVVDGDKSGSVEVYYMEEKPELDEGPFLAEERDLISSLSRMLGGLISNREARAREDHLNSVLRSIRNVNQLLVKENKKDKLIERVCDNLTESRGYYNAWIALFDESNELVGSAQSGLGDSFAKMRRLLDGGNLPQRVETTLNQSGVIVTEDPPSSCKDSPLAEEYSGRASLTVRLAYEGTVYGLLAVSIPNAFIDDEEEHGLIEEVAGDIAYGLHDIAVENDRRSARAELKTEKKKFQEIFNNANDPMYLHELDENGMPGKFVEVNDPACQALGYQREELLQMSPADIDATEAREDVPSIMKQLVDRGELTFEMTHRTKNGNKIPVEISSHVFTLEGKTRVLSIARDITDRKKSEWELRKQHMAMESSVDGMAILNEDEEYVYVNEAHADIYGYDAPEELIGRSWKVLYEGKQLKRFEEVVMPKLFEEGEWRGEAMGKRKDGGKFPQEVSLTTLEGGGLVCVVRDVTARKRAEKKLKENERRFRNYLESSPLGIFVADEKGNYVSVNRAAERITGYKRNELLGMNFLDLIPEEYRGEAQANFQTLSEQEEASIEIPFIRKDGAKRYWNVKSVKVSDGRFLGFVEDITERRELEDQSKLDRQKLQESFVELAETTSRVLGVRDPYTQEHEQRVAELAREVGRRMGLEEERSLGLYLGGLLHDIGKIVVPETILTKPGELTDIEWQMIKSHPEVGYDKILKDTDFPWPVAEMTLHHHERLDGSGYPDGLEGDELTTEVRILAAVDVVEAMSTRRPYRRARTKEETLEEITGGRGSKYDPEVVDVIVDMVKEGEIEFGDK